MDTPTRQTTYCRCGDKEVAPQAYVRATTGRGGQGQQLVEHLCMGVRVWCDVCACMCVGSGVCMRVGRGYFDPREFLYMLNMKLGN